MSNSSFSGRLLTALPDTLQQTVLRIGYRLTPLSVLLLYLNSGLQNEGWFRSRFEQMPVDRNGDPIPWMNYPVIHFLTRRLADTHNVFEFGSGNSTIWYSIHANRVVSIEHDPEWTEIIAAEVPDNGDVKTISEREEYTQAIKSEAWNIDFDVIVVDGQWRNECIIQALEVIPDQGVIILDDSEREEHAPTRNILYKEGYKELKFTGMKPITRQNVSTSIFYKEDNCLEI